ncbi:Insulin-like growth factor I [Channa argus]|uniref:Insulin-like growth factor I n=1 Tax=Channa argus TaxID=215402 RepID=A0A6G1Q204_CHAAH|nr:Insulin-like growth factor I [Channa argus]
MSEFNCVLFTSRLQVLCARVCVFYSTVCLAGWPLGTDATRLRCGSDLLSDLIFVCGDRGIYLGKGKWSGYGARPRGKGIVDQCCRPAGCDLHHLEMYCAKPKSQQQFEAVFQKRLLGHLGPPNSPKREAYRKKPTPSLPKKNKASPSRGGINTQDTTSRPPSASRSPLQRTLLLVTS